MNATWYDLLDVEPSAPTPRILAAWKGAIDGLDPTDRRFRKFNEAAAVLLDDERRAAYDAELAASQLPEEEAEESTDEPTGVGLAPAARPARRPVPSWLLVSLALLVGVVAAGALALVQLRPADGAVAQAAASAESAARRAAPAIFSYDYRHLDVDHDAAAGFMTADYRARYDPLFEVIRENAPGLQTATRADFIASGLVRTGAGDQADDRVQVFVVFDQLTTHKGRSEPSRTPAFATLTMQREGQNWLVDDVQGPPVAG